MTAQERSDWLTIPEMARRLGVSEATLKRRRADGRPVKLPSGDAVDMEWELLERPQGHEYRARVRGALPPLSTVQERIDSKEQAPLTTAQDTSEALAALRGIIDQERAERQQLTARIAALEREAGQLEGRAVAAEASYAALLAELTAARAKRPWWRFWA